MDAVEGIIGGKHAKKKGAAGIRSGGSAGAINDAGRPRLYWYSVRFPLRSR